MSDEPSLTEDPGYPRAAPTDQWVKIISSQGNIRAMAMRATGLVDSLARRHKLEGTYAQGLGEAVMGALTIASYCKPGTHVNLNVQAEGCYRQALVDAYPDGSVRGYLIGRPMVDAKITGDQGPWGDGFISLLRAKDGSAEKPYIGTVPLVTGHLAKDLTFYWYQSEQVHSAVGLAVKWDGEKVVAAGGFLVQALPGATDAELKQIEKHIREIQALEAGLALDADPMRVLGTIFQDTAFMVLEERPLTFKCQCSWERVERALSLVGVPELVSILTEVGHAEVHCDFCAREYQVDSARLQALIDASRSPSGA